MLKIPPPSPLPAHLAFAVPIDPLQVVYYPPQRGRPEERTVWADETDFVLIFRGNLIGVRKKITYKLADLQTVSTGSGACVELVEGETWLGEGIKNPLFLKSPPISLFDVWFRYLYGI